MRIPRFTADNSFHTFIPQSFPQSPVIQPQLSVNGGPSDSCTEDYQNCYVDCSVRYPESQDSSNNLNAMYRQACLDSCDASYRLCSPGNFMAGRRRGIGTVARIGQIAS